MTRRRLTWIIHNVLMTPFMPLRVVLLFLIWVGETSERIGLRTPGWRPYDNWRGW